MLKHQEILFVMFYTYNRIAYKISLKPTVVLRDMVSQYRHLIATLLKYFVFPKEINTEKYWSLV